MRLDVFLVDRDLAKSRETAKTMIRNNQVSVNDKIITKAAFNVTDLDNVKVINNINKYVSRGGYKLEKAITVFNIDLRNKICMDIGASTGGFTDCMLKSGARKVYAIDVGHSQLDSSLSENPNVVNIEKTNIRYLDNDFICDKISFISTDVSFISIKLVLPKIYEFLISDGEAVLLIKPQFEAGREHIGKSGIVRSRSVHKKVLEEICNCSFELGFSVLGLDYSPITGGDGNIEYLLHIAKQTKCDYYDLPPIYEVVDTAFNYL